MKAESMRFVFVTAVVLLVTCAATMVAMGSDLWSVSSATPPPPPTPTTFPPPPTETPHWRV
jgi:hypothetical protein